MSDEFQADPSRLIDEKLRALGDWRGEMLGRVRALIRKPILKSQKRSSGGSPRTPQACRCGNTTASSALAMPVVDRGAERLARIADFPGNVPC
jgi:hypothetical protein